MSVAAIPATAPQILQANTAFTSKLYQILSRQPGNVFFSPFNLHAALALLHQGARGDTAKILGQVLQLPDAASTPEAYKWILDDLKNTENVSLHIANKIYVRQKEKFVEDFESSVQEYFKSEVEVLDFAKKVETVKRINEWVERKTSEKIKEVVDEDSIDAETALFLLNAIYFKADWEEKFKNEQTTKRSFYLDDEKIVDVDTMKGRKLGCYKNDEELSAEIVRLPYKGKRIEMVIILPKARNGIQDLEAKLTTLSLADVISKNFYETKVDLWLPKFKFRTSIDLDDVLKEMGLDVIFDDCKANFRGMLVIEDGENLSVDKVLPMAYIDVNEEGSEAAAVTVVKVKKRAKCEVEELVVDFVVDHPAMFLLVENGQHGVNILFCGRLYHPKY